MADDDRHGHHYPKLSLQDESSDSIGIFEKRLCKSLGIDTRHSVLDFRRAKNFLLIFTDSVSGAVQISRFYDKARPPFKIKVVLLPDDSVNELTKGVCHVGVAPIRKANDSSSEQVTQFLYGESFDALQVDGDWIRVRLHADGYIGWVSANQVTLFGENDFARYKLIPKVYVSESVLPLLKGTQNGTQAIREAVFGSALALGRR